ncbi:transposase, partial [Enterococcus faecalis]|uniref:transposase n=1 Tax=Enterococcus faecalis TaxID=1351 RepID=UPI001D174618
LNNILEQDHRQVKGKFPYGNSFQSTYTAATTIKGIEVVSALYKESRRVCIFLILCNTTVPSILNHAL